jgi:penicillin-binding protein 1C
MSWSAAAGVRSLKARGRIALVAFAAAAASALLFAGVIVSLGSPRLGEDLVFSVRVVDRDGRLLRAYADADGRWRLPVEIADVDPRFFDILLAYEDRRFRAHHGVDPLALMRAAFQFAESGRIRSGGSTLTMQVARLLEPRVSRSLGAKLHQVVRAIEIERLLSKDGVLKLYLDLAPYGGNIEGIRAASLAYFGKEPHHLSLAQAALLVALPQSPEWRRPDRSADQARAARDRVLDRYGAVYGIPRDEIAQAKAEPVPKRRVPMPLLAPHAADREIAARRSDGVVALTIRADAQSALEVLARERLRGLSAALGTGVSLAAMAVDNRSGDVIARVGAPDYFDARRAGQIDMTRATRSPGSTLKPFIYGLGFEDGFIHPETLIDDRADRYGTYAPQNFDFSFHGTVTVRTALQMSLNLPALAVLDRVGPSRLTARLAQAGVSLILPPGEVPGLAIGLGGAGTSLSDLVMLYAAIARLGNAVPLHERLEATQSDGTRLLDPPAAWYVAHVLAGTPPPENGAVGRIAFKTGTSYGYRDAWSIGFDGRYTVGVWVGRPDGAPVPGLIGRSAAAPILFDAFSRLERATVPLPRAPNGVLAAGSARLPPPLQRFTPAGMAGTGATGKLRILYPPDGARFEVGRDGARPDPVALKVSGAVAPLTVFVNGAPLAATGRGNPTLQPDGPGFDRVTVIDATGTAASIMIRFDERPAVTALPRAAMVSSSPGPPSSTSPAPPH